MSRKAAMLALASLVSAACAVPTGGVCESDADCAAGAVCQDNLCVGGAVPVATVIAPENVDFQSLVVLDGSTSAREDGSKEGLVYEWKVLAPQGVDFEGPSDTASVSLRASIPHGVYKVELVTRDLGTPSAPSVREIKVRNSKPVAAFAAEPTTWTRNTEITLDATSSSDPDADPLSFEWSLVQDPANAGGELVAGDGGLATLTTGAVAAKYTVKLVVSDDHGASDDETLSQTLGNTPPTLDPGEAVTVEHACTPSACRAEFDLVGLVTDVDGTIVDASVAWSLKSAPPGANANAVFQPVVKEGTAFTASTVVSNDPVDPLVGDYVFELAATDNDGDTSTATVTVTLGNEKPSLVFNEEAPFEVAHSFEGGKFVATVEASVTATDPEGDKLNIEMLVLVPSLPGANVARVLGATPDTATYTIRVDAANPTSLIDATDPTTPLYTLRARVTDINGAVSDVAELPVVILNRPPALKAGTLKVGNKASAHTVYSCNDQQSGCSGACRTPPVACTINQGVTVTHWGSGTSGGLRPRLDAVFEDPDGDPVVATWSGSSGRCEFGGGPCPLYGNRMLDAVGAIYSPSVNCASGSPCTPVTDATVGHMACIGGSTGGLFTIVGQEITFTVTSRDAFEPGTGGSLDVTASAGAEPGKLCPIREDPGDPDF